MDSSDVRRWMVQNFAKRLRSLWRSIGGLRRRPYGSFRGVSYQARRDNEPLWSRADEVERITGDHRQKLARITIACENLHGKSRIRPKDADF